MVSCLVLWLGGGRRLARQSEVIGAVLATSFVTSHTSTAFAFSMRCIILFSASQRHRAWDMRSSERPVVLDEGSFLAKAREM